MSQDGLVKGLETAFWPGRAQTVKRDNVDWFFDGAHTPESIQVCAKWFKTSVDSNLR